MHILVFQSENHRPAIHQAPTKADAVFSCQRQQSLFSHLPQITGYDQIVVCFSCVEIIKMRTNRGKCCRG